VADLKAVLDNRDKATFEAKTNSLTRASHKLVERIYAQASLNQRQTQGQTYGGGGPGEGQAGPTASDDNVVDAEFEEVKDGKKNSPTLHYASKASPPTHETYPLTGMFYGKVERNALKGLTNNEPPNKPLGVLRTVYYGLVKV
jgi:hypothetical protein